MVLQTPRTLRCSSTVWPLAGMTSTSRLRPGVVLSENRSYSSVRLANAGDGTNVRVVAACRTAASGAGRNWARSRYVPGPGTSSAGLSSTQCCDGCTTICFFVVHTPPRLACRVTVPPSSSGSTPSCAQTAEVAPNWSEVPDQCSQWIDVVAAWAAVGASTPATVPAVSTAPSTVLRNPRMEPLPSSDSLAVEPSVSEAVGLRRSTRADE